MPELECDSCLPFAHTVALRCRNRVEDKSDVEMKNKKMPLLRSVPAFIDAGNMRNVTACTFLS